MGHTGGEHVRQAVAGSVALLRTAVDRDWEAVRAGGLEWSCRRTAEHIADDLIAYAGRLAARADSSVPFDLTVDDGAGNEGVLQVIETMGALLVAAVRTAPRAVRAYHPYPFRSANRDGFAAMGVAEVLLHTRDIAEGLGLAYEPPAASAEYVLTTIFPEVRPDPDPWRTLLWATGRGELPGRAPVTEWRWQNNLVLPADRLTLEGLTPAAAADLAAGGDGGFDWVEGGPYEGTREASGMLVKAYEAGVHRPEFGVFVLVRREDDRAVGGLGFHGAPDEEGRVEIGYDLAAPARGNGYATEALQALSAWALARDDVRTLMATVEHANWPSQAVVKRAGFVRATLEEERAMSESRESDGPLHVYLRTA
ncbi:Protein N-acetyltransferase, RimJ/RimL family [Streptomyces sp. DI166]|uniref:GNAT family N-acetyltransferase n=1 Tax=unclassified Streptomyces TaxID=2593676 RepID=UPI0007F460B3|nr:MULTISPECIES: GNAT family N-acetyltransferase [unclassified Streptomyces]SBT92002.1 Protein N-acetyltransferase, RimJ/RimL family [Streptomyces sp. DI166]